MIVLFISALLFSLPFIPTLIEILHPSDDKATPISRFQLQDVRNTKQEFFSILEFLLQNEKWLTVDAYTLNPLQDSPLRGIYALRDIEAQAGAHTITVAAEKSLTCLAGAKIYEAHAKEKIILQNGSEIMWWATAPVIEVYTETYQRGKLEAHEHLRVLGSCHFSNLKSKRIEIGLFAPVTPPAPVLSTTTRQVFFKRWQNQEKTLIGDCVITHHARVTAGTVIKGGLKVDRDLVIERGCRIEGHVFVGGNLYSEGETVISGVVIVEKNLYLGPGHEIGREDAIITVSADEIKTKGPQLIHGTLRSWEQGQIELS